MQGFTGIKDLDKELMLNMGDREFIQTCRLNKYFQNICKDDFLFKRKLEKFYPDTLQRGRCKVSSRTGSRYTRMGQ